MNDIWAALGGRVASVRLMNCVNSARYEKPGQFSSIKDVAAAGRDFWKKQYGIGKKTLAELEGILADEGLFFDRRMIVFADVRFADPRFADD
jgi:hypothetical protein